MYAIFVKICYGEIMKKLSLYIFLVLMFCNISFSQEEFSIDGMSLSDTVLKYYTEKEIKKETKNIYGDNLYTQFTISSKNSNSNYDSYQIHYKLGDKNYIIESVAGVKWTESFNQCKKLKEKIKKELSIFFSITETAWINKENEDDESKTSMSYFYFDNRDSVDIQCKDWNSTAEFRDNLRVSLWTAEFEKFIISFN